MTIGAAANGSPHHSNVMKSNEGIVMTFTHCGNSRYTYNVVYDRPRVFDRLDKKLTSVLSTAWLVLTS